jgi:ABC-type nickel/cobalt efflux system permease component RcnA
MNTMLKAAAIVALTAGAIVCFGMAVIGMIVLGMANDAGDKWWTQYLSIPLLAVLGGLVLFHLRWARQLGRSLLGEHGYYLPEERAQERRSHRPVTRQEFLTAGLVLGY